MADNEEIGGSTLLPDLPEMQELSPESGGLGELPEMPGGLGPVPGEGMDFSSDPGAGLSGSPGLGSEPGAGLGAGPGDEMPQLGGDLPQFNETDEMSELEPEIDFVINDTPAQGSKGGTLIDDNRIQSIKVKVQVMLGGTSLSVAQLAQLREGDTVALTSKISDPVQILANGQVIGQGKVVVIESDPPTFGVRLENVIDVL
ncbi:MAG: FliM/FliN family flagellar motor switch protein [Nitratireductor sp.]|nr:FliM/FliN family flagellar motor switch protein [Nitratireductor sp.]MCC0019906.1 FliM/FliN family flagellar motor switch protein [Nitratireductor sp.]